MKQISDMNVKEIIEAYTDHTPAVYLVGDDGGKYGFYKIGRAKNPWFRIKGLDSTKLPFELEMLFIVRVGDAASWVETKLHQHFDEYRLRGEWFKDIPYIEFMRVAKALHKAWLKGER